MAERLSIDLELIDRVGGPAKAAANALRGVEEAAKRAQSAGLDKLGAAFAKVGTRAATDQQKQQRQFADAWAKIGMKAETDRIKALDRENRARARAVSLAQKQQERAAAKKAKQKAEESENFVTSAKIAAGLFAVGVGGALVAAAVKATTIFAHGFKEAVKAGAEYEQLKLSYKLSLGEKGGKEALADIGRFSKQTGLDDDEIAKLMRPLFNAGLRGQAARSAFAAAGDLSAASGRPIEEFTDLLAKIQLKGGLSEKMLVGLGLDAKGFKAELAKNLGTSKETAMERASSGKVDPQHILNALYTQIEKRQGGQLGTGTEAFAATMGAKLHLLGQLPGNYLKMVADSEAWPKMTERMAAILDGLDPDGPKGKRIIGSLTAAFESVVGLAERALTPENIEKFASTLTWAVETLGKVPEIFGAIYDKVMQLKPILAELGVDLDKTYVTNTVESADARRKADEYEARVSAGRSGAGAGYGYGSVLADTPSPQRPASAGGKGPQIFNVPRVEVNVHPAKDDVAHTTTQVGRAVGSTVAKATARAAQEGGGG